MARARHQAEHEVVDAGSSHEVKDLTPADKRRERRARARAGLSNPTGRPFKPNHMGERRLIKKRMTWQAKHSIRKKQVAKQQHALAASSPNAEEPCIIGFGTPDVANGLCSGDWRKLKCCGATVCTACFSTHWQQHGKAAGDTNLRQAHNCPACRTEIGACRQAFS